MQKYSHSVEDIDLGAVTLVVKWAKTIENVQLKRCMGLGSAPRFPAEFFEYFVSILRISEECFSKDVWQSRCRPSQPFFLVRKGLQLNVYVDHLETITFGDGAKKFSRRCQRW